MGKKKKKQVRGIDVDQSGGVSRSPAETVIPQRHAAASGVTKGNHVAGRRNGRKSPLSVAAPRGRSPPGTGAGLNGRRPHLQEDDNSHGATGKAYSLRTRPHTSDSSRGARDCGGRGRTSRPGSGRPPANDNHRRTMSAPHGAKRGGGGGGGAGTGRHLYNHLSNCSSSNNNHRRWRRNPFRGGYGGYQQTPRQSQGNTAETPQSTSINRPTQAVSSATEGGGGSELEIPGFYYDAVKKKYFKILPGHHSANSSMITRDIIKLKQTEEARQQSLREFALKTIRMDPSYRTGCMSAQKARCRYSSNLLDHVNCVQTGAVPAHESRLVQHRLMNHQLRNLGAFCKRRVFERDCGLYQRLEHMVQMVAAPGGDIARVLCLWSLEGLIVQRIQLLDIGQMALRGRRTRAPDGATAAADTRAGTLQEGATASLSVRPVGAVVLQSFSKVTHVCWAPASTEQTANVPILYTTTYFIGNNPSLALLRTLDGESASSGGGGGGTETTPASPYTEFHLGHQTTWTCAWSIHKQKFSIGCKDSALVIDVATRRLWELFTKKSDVYTQAFSNGDGNTLYSGTQKGVVVGHDLRSSSTRHVTSLSHRSPVCHIHLLTDDTHLIAGDFSGRLCMWDLRMRGVVQDYIGHNNEYVRLPFKVDRSESMVCGVGQDCYTRVWDLQSGALLTSVPPPYPASRDLIPAVAIYTAPQGRLDRPGVLMGIKDEVHFYAA